ncbi:MAG TPA: carboxypeptidase regulatory-like domain-containing protein [Tepidisphaeraceae bacterium]|nr:carboxypeptidase regulatory-like domain-containing protein [Tepidisphaeraceae bacterium]
MNSFRHVRRANRAAAHTSRRLAIYAASILCIVALAATTARSQRASASPASKPAAASATRPSAPRELHIRIVNAVTGQPVAGVRGSYVLDDKVSKSFKYDDHGEYRIPLPPQTHSLYFFYAKDGFVQSIVEFGRVGSDAQIPAEYTVRLQPGLLVGGIVTDEKGKAVDGAQVGLNFLSPRRSIGTGYAKTDAKGRWTFNGALAGAATIGLYVQHPDFIMNSFRHELPGSRFQELRDKRLITTIRRGATLSGVVRDLQGSPIANAEVTPDRFGMISGTHTDAQGHFILRGVAPGPARIKAIADGYAPQMINAQADAGAGAGAKPLELVLEKGRLLQGRVVDKQGKPIADALVTIAKWRDEPGVGGFWGRTDADGRFKWNSAPADAVTLSIGDADYMPATVVAIANGKELAVVLEPAIIVRGTVVDDETGGAIEKFAVSAIIENVNPRMETDMQVPSAAGNFQLRLTERGELYSVRVQAPGYLPVQSPRVGQGGRGTLVFNVRMKRGRRITGIILGPDGKPASGADVALEEIMAVQADNGVLRRNPGANAVVVKTDAAGRFALPPRQGLIKVLVVHENGWLEFKQDVSLPEQTYSLRPWAIVKGQLLIGDKPLARRMVVIRPIVFADRVTHEVSAKNYFQYQATTDAQGRFEFDRVVDGKSELYVPHGLAAAVPVLNGARGNAFTLELAPGEHRTLKLGGSGRPVIGRAIIPQELTDRGLAPGFGELRRFAPEYIQPENPAQWKAARAQFEQSDAYRKYISQPNTFAIVIQPDGKFRGDDVPEGDYTLSIMIEMPTPGEPNMYRITASANVDVRVPSMPGGKSSDPLDVGTVQVKVHHYLNVGETAPPFVADTFDGKKLKLSDLRGKYVLLDFWATWCAPCVAELKDLEKLHRELAGDNRIVILGISIDGQMTAPKKFLEKRKLPWPQVFAGDVAESSARQAFGVQAIPSVWLIGPDGKILAKEIDAAQVEQTVKEALAEKPR